MESPVIYERKCGVSVLRREVTGKEPHAKAGIRHLGRCPRGANLQWLGASAMIWTLIHKEILDQILSIRFYISLALALLFLVPATYMQATDYQWLHREMGPLLKEGFYTPPNYGSYWLNRDIPTLRVLATGLDEELSLRSRNRAWTGLAFNNRKFVHNPLPALFSRLDFVFFINIVGSLLAFAFTYDAVSGERQSGTLRLIMTHAISRPLFLLAKFFGSYISFVVSLLPALVGEPFWYYIFIQA